MSECHIDHKISAADTLSQTHLCALAIVYVASMAVRSTTARGWQCGKMLVAYHQHLLPLNDRTSWLLCVYGYLFVAANVYVQLFICMGISLYICVLQLYAIRVALQKCLLLGSCCCCMLLIFSSVFFSTMATTIYARIHCLTVSTRSKNFVRTIVAFAKVALK